MKCTDERPCINCFSDSGKCATGFTEEQKERFELRARDMIQWLCDNGNPHMTIIITPTTAELLSGEMAIQTNDYVRGNSRAADLGRAHALLLEAEDILSENGKKHASNKVGDVAEDVRVMFEEATPTAE